MSHGDGHGDGTTTTTMSIQRARTDEKRGQTGYAI
jgi:hypothetical protein